MTDAARTIELTEYEIANLKAALVFVGKFGADTGDWYAQVLRKLPDVEVRPNKTWDELRDDLFLRTGASVLRRD